MIGWKANYGYAPQSLPITNISQITFSDVNRPFTIGTHLLTPPNGLNYGGDNYKIESSSVSDGVTYFYQSNNDGAVALERMCGADYSSIYVSPYNSQSNIVPINLYNLKSIIPSAGLAAPNLFSDYINHTTPLLNYYIYIPALKRLLYGYFVFSVGDDGSVTKIYEGSFNDPKRYPLASLYFFNDESGYVYYAFFPNFDGTVESIINSEIYRIQVKFGHGNGRIAAQKITKNSYTKQFLNAVFGSYSPPDIEIPDNPYEPGGPSGPTDPALPPGTFDDESDPIPDSSLPTLSAANTGFTRIYNPTLSQVQALAHYLWTDPDVIQTIWNHIKQFFENPMEAIIGFNLVPVPIPDGGTENFALMYIDTGVQMTVAANQFVDLDCGTLELKRYYGSALDQSPYTKVSCYLPYIGTVNLNTDEVMGTTLQVKYRIDIVSGSCVAKIFVDENCLYQYSGHCAITIPISSADFSSYVSAAISVGKLAAAAITAGASAAMAVGVAEASQQTNQVVTTTQVTNTARNPSTGRQITTGTTTTVQTRESPADQSSTQASFSGLSPQNVANTVGAIMSSKPHIEHSGSFSGNSGYLGVRRPFLIIERPNMCMPANYQALNGFPAMITMELSTCKGFTRVQQVQLTGMGRATNPEQAEILELLKSGVIL